MSDERLFQIALIAGFLVFFPCAIYFRVRAHATGEPLDRRQEGWLILLTLRPAGFLYMFTLLMYAIDPARLAWSSMGLPVGLRWAGVAVFFGAAALFLWTLMTLGPNLTDTVVTRRAHTLVTRGPYQWVRHPFYVAVALMGIGTTLATASWFLAVVFVVFFSLIVMRTRIEEEKLVARFGDSYRDYMERTGRFWP
jgi:protein-S-isoprenylcysteine O-methyltransferase Ste14